MIPRVWRPWLTVQYMLLTTRHASLTVQQAIFSSLLVSGCCHSDELFGCFARGLLIMWSASDVALSNYMLPTSC